MSTDAATTETGPLSVDEAVGLLSAPDEAAPVEAQEVATQSEAEPSADDAADPEAPVIEGDEDAGDGDPDEVPAIEPPASWAAEDKALFATLPPEAQAVIAARETERDRATSKALQEARDAQKRAEQEAAGVSQYKGLLDGIVQSAQAQFADRWAHMDAAAWVAWAQQDPDAAQLGRFQYEAEMQELNRVQLAQQQTEAIEFQNFKTAEGAKLAEIAPHLVDPVEGKARREAVGKFLLDQGIPAENLKYVSAAELTIAEKAMKWDQAQANLKTPKTPPRPAAPAPARPAVRPGAAQHSSAAQRNVERLGNRLAQTRSIDDAVDYMIAKGI